MNRRAYGRWILAALACACFLPVGTARCDEDPVKLARKAFVAAMRLAKKERRPSPDRTVMTHVLNVARKVRSPAALDLLRDVAVETHAPSQRSRVIRMLAAIEAKPAEPPDEAALRLAEAARAHPLDIRPTSFLTPTWTVQDAVNGNAAIVEALSSWFATELRKRPLDAPYWGRKVARHRRRLARLAFADAITEVLPPEWALHVARSRVAADKMPEVRALWIRALALYGDVESAPRVLSQSRSKNLALREASLRALELLAPDDPETRARFLDGFGSKIAIEVALAAREAGRQQSDRTAGKLWAALGSSYWEARAQAVESLARVRTRRSVEVLVKALPDMKLDMHARCLRSLRRLTGLELYSTRAWQAWWLRNLTFQPTETEAPATAAGDVRGRVDVLPPEGRRFTVFCFLPTGEKLPSAERSGLASLFFDLANGVDEEGAIAIRAGAWWSIRGKSAKRVKEPSRRVPSASSRGSRRSGAGSAWPSKPAPIPYLDPLRPVLETARQKLPTILASNVSKRSSALTDELATVFATAETESIVLLSSRDVNMHVSMRLLAAQRRLRWSLVGRPVRVRLAHYGKEAPRKLVHIVKALGGAWMVRKPPIPEAAPRPKKEQAPTATKDTGWVADRHGEARGGWAPSGDIGRGRAHCEEDGRIVLEIEPAHPFRWSKLTLWVYVDVDDTRATGGHAHPSSKRRAVGSGAWSKTKAHAWFGADVCLRLEWWRQPSNKDALYSNLQYIALHGKKQGAIGPTLQRLEDGRIRLEFHPDRVASSIEATRTIGLRCVLTCTNQRLSAFTPPTAPDAPKLDRIPGFRPQTTRVPLPYAAGTRPGLRQGLDVEFFAMRRGERIAYLVHADPHTADWALDGDLEGRLYTTVSAAGLGAAGAWGRAAYARKPAEVLATILHPDDQAVLARFPGLTEEKQLRAHVEFTTTDRWPDAEAGGVRLLRSR